MINSFVYFSPRLYRLGRPGVSVQVRHDPVADPSASVSGASGAGIVAGGMAGGGGANPGMGSGSGPGGSDRSNVIGMASGSSGSNHHSGAGIGPGGANISSSSGSSSSLLGASGTTSGHNPVDRSSAGGVGSSGSVPPNVSPDEFHFPLTNDNVECIWMRMVE